MVADGPAFQSSLIYPGDKLCCINDFDLAWSGNVPRSQQPQLPGPHGSSVTLTFDRSADSSQPERFAITMIRNKVFFPDKLTGSLFSRAPESSPTKLGKNPELEKSELREFQLKPLSSSGQPAVPSSGSQNDLKLAEISASGRNIMMQHLANGGSPSSASDTNPTAHHIGDIGVELLHTRKDANLEVERTSPPHPHDDRRQGYLEQENRTLQETVKSLRRDLTDSHVQTSFLQRQLKLKSEDRGNDAGLSEKHLFLIKQRESEILELQAKLSKEHVQREAAERRVAHAKEESDRMLSVQLDTKARIENFQEMLVKETLDRQKVQTRLTEVETELRGMESLKSEARQLQARNDELMAELHAARQSERDATNSLKALQADYRAVQAQNEELSSLKGLQAGHKALQADFNALQAQHEDLAKEVVTLRQLMKQSEASAGVAPPPPPPPDRPKQAADQSVYDVLISTGTSQREPWEQRERLAPTRERERSFASPGGGDGEQEWAQSLQMNGTPVKAGGMPTAEPSADVELHQSPGALRNDAWRNGSGDLLPTGGGLAFPPRGVGGGGSLSFASSSRSTPASRASPKSPATVYVSPNRLDDSPPSLYQNQNNPRQLYPGAVGGGAPMYGAPSEYLSVPPMSTESLPLGRRPLDHKAQQGFAASYPSNSARAAGSSRRAGIGMSFHLDTLTRNYVIKEVHPQGSAGQAAANGDLLVGDVLLAVNGLPCTGKLISEVIDLIIGPEGTEVQLTLKRKVAAENYQITLTLLRNRPLSSSSPTEPQQRPLAAMTSMSSPPKLMDQRPAGAHGIITFPASRSPTTTLRAGQSLRPSDWERSRPQDSFQSVITPQPLSRSASGHSVKDRELPPGWIQELDPSSGRIYFVNHELKTFCWNRPGQ